MNPHILQYTYLYVDNLTKTMNTTNLYLDTLTKTDGNNINPHRLQMSQALLCLSLTSLGSLTKQAKNWSSSSARLLTIQVLNEPDSSTKRDYFFELSSARLKLKFELNSNTKRAKPRAAARFVCSPCQVIIHNPTNKYRCIQLTNRYHRADLKSHNLTRAQFISMNKHS